MKATRKYVKKYNDTQHRLFQYLNSGLEKGKHYFKSKYIAKGTGSVPEKRWVTNMAILSEICQELAIIKWSYSNSTTWMVTSRPV